MTRGVTSRGMKRKHPQQNPCKKQKSALSNAKHSTWSNLPTEIKTLILQSALERDDAADLESADLLKEDNSLSLAQIDHESGLILLPYLQDKLLPSALWQDHLVPHKDTLRQLRLTMCMIRIMEGLNGKSESVSRFPSLREAYVKAWQ